MEDRLSEKIIDDIFETEYNIMELFNRSPVLFAVTDSDGYFKIVSNSWENTTGYSKEELTSKPWIEFVHPNDAGKTMTTYEETENGYLPTHGFKNRYKVKSGGWVELEWFSTGSSLNGLNLAIAIPRRYER